MPQVIFMNSGCRPFAFFCDADGNAITSQYVAEDAGTCTVRVRLAPAVLDPAFPCYGGAAAAYTPAPWPVTIEYSVEAWTPDSGCISAVPDDGINADPDFLPETGTLTWAQGDTEKTIVFDISDAADGFHSHWDKNQIAVRLHTPVGCQISVANPLPVQLVDNEPEDPQYILGTAEAEHQRLYGANAITAAADTDQRRYWNCPMADTSVFALNGFGIALPLAGSADSGERYRYRQYASTVSGTTYQQVIEANRWVPSFDYVSPPVGWPPTAGGSYPPELDTFDQRYQTEWEAALDAADLATTLVRTATEDTEGFTGITAGTHISTTLDGDSGVEYTEADFEDDFDTLWAAAAVRGGYESRFFFRPWSTYGEVEAVTVGTGITPNQSPGTPTLNTAAVTLLHPCDGDGDPTGAIPDTMTAPGLTATLDAAGLATSVAVDTAGTNVPYGDWLASLPGGKTQILTLETKLPEFTEDDGNVTNDTPADGTIADTAVTINFAGAGEVIASHQSRSVNGAVVWRKKKAAVVGSTGTWIHVADPIKVEVELNTYDWANSLVDSDTVDITENDSYSVPAPTAEGYITATLILTPQSHVCSPGNSAYP